MVSELGMVRLAFILSLGLFAGGILAANAVAARPLATGVTVTDVMPQEQLGFDRIRSAGASFTRVIVHWSSVAPYQKPEDWDPTDPADPNYDWAYVDSQIVMATNAGLQPLVTVYSAPTWAERCQDPIGGICNPDPEAFALFSEAVAKRYNGDFGGLPRVRYWQPWNEPNLFLFFKPQFEHGRKVSPGLYRELLNRFHATVKGVDATNLVVAGGLAPIERPGGVGPLDFARRLLCMKGNRRPVPIPGCGQVARFDIWSNNPYTTGGPTHESAGKNDVSLGDLPEMARLLRAAKAAKKIRGVSKKVPFWVTEFSWDSKPPDPGGVPMKRLTRWTSEAMFRAWRAGVTNFFWLSLRDWPRTPGLPYSETIESGLYFRGSSIARDRPKMILKAFRFPFVSFRKPTGIAIWGRTPKSTPGRVSISYRLGGKRKRLRVVRAGPNGVFRALIKTALGKNKRGLVSARHRGALSVAFSLKGVRDYRQPPFGRRGQG